MLLISKNQFPRNRKKSPVRKNKLRRKFQATRYTHLAYLYRPSIFIIIYLQSQPSLMRPVGWGGVRDLNGFSRLLLPFIRCQLSVPVNFSFSYNTLFLSSLGFMAAQYTTSGAQFYAKNCWTTRVAVQQHFPLIHRIYFVIQTTIKSHCQEWKTSPYSHL